LKFCSVAAALESLSPSNKAIVEGEIRRLQLEILNSPSLEQYERLKVRSWLLTRSLLLAQAQGAARQVL
jgi:hypothetical protein